MLSENKNLEKEYKSRKFQKIGKIIFWIGTIILMIGMFLGFLILARGYEWDLTAGIMTIAIIGGPGLVLALIGLAIKKGAIKKYVLILFLCGVFASIFGSFYGGLSKEFFPKIAVKMKSPFICQIIAYELPRDNCYLDVSRVKKDFIPCGKLSEKGDRYYCYRVWAEDLKNPSLCEKIPSQGTIRFGSDTDIFRNQIHGEFEKIYDIDLSEIKDACYKALIPAIKDPKICEKISDPWIKKYCYSRTKIKSGFPYLGVYYILIDKEVQNYFNLSVDRGALVHKMPNIDEPAVTLDSPADKAGIKEKDIILEVDGKKITKENDLNEIIKRYGIGNKITLKILHQEKEMGIKAVLEEKP